MSRVRPFAAEDAEPVAALIGETLGLSGIDAASLARDVLLAENFVPEHLLVAESANRPVGFLWAPRRDALAPGPGWIAALGVAPECRRRGIGTALVERALSGMRAEGIDRVEIAQVPVRYWVPGIDRQAFPAAHAWFTGPLGFVVRDEVASMGIGLAEPIAFPADPAIRLCNPGDYPALKAWLTEEFDPGWWGYFERSILARLAGDPTPSEVIAAFEEDRPIGVVHYRAERFGPLAVAGRARGRGLGAALTRAALARMRTAGLERAYFLVAGPAVQPFYTRLGFSILRRFTRLTRKL